MRMLFLSTRLPFPPIGGERLRPFYFIKYLALRWKITILSFFDSQREKKAARNYLHNIPGLEICHLSLPRLRSYLQSAAGLFSLWPIEIAYYADRQMRSLVERQIKTREYDLIFCHLLRMAPYVQDIQGIKKVLDISDALSLRYEISSRYRKGPFKFIEHIESRRLKQYEPGVAEKFDLNLISSSIDKDHLEAKLGISKLEVIENGIEPDMINQAETSSIRQKIVFFGNLRIFHNVDAIRYFYQKIFPLIRAKIKDAQLVIVGANIPRCILKLRQDSAVSVFRDVPDLFEYVRDASVSIAPMRIAVGIQNKILQSMAYGVPVVTTTLGLGGIKARPNREVLVADKPEEFARQVIALMQDGCLKSSIVKNAHTLIKEHYLWPEICEQLHNRLISLITK
ncbi:glycosyltransferase [bacterium]|nr:MAG: glycosyltransferase [bacterium]